MPEPPARETFLRTVADAVDLQPAEVGEVLEELSGHLSDAAAVWRDAGLDPDDAERRAIRGLGDPTELGRELGRARHKTRRLLAGAAGGVWAALTFGLWSYLTIWLLAAGIALSSLLLSVAIIHALGQSMSGWFTGPLASGATVLITALWFGWIGSVLPARVARRASRSVRGVRRAVGVVGVVGASALLWLVPTLDLDWVLAVGLPLGPLAFLWAALHASGAVSLFPPTRARTRLGMFAAAVVVVTGLGFLTATPQVVEGGWEADTSSLGASSTTEPLLDAAILGMSWSVAQPHGRSLTSVDLTISDETQTAAFLQRFKTLQLEVWPATVQDGVLVFGVAPLKTAAVPVTDLAELSIDMPTYRTPVSVATLTVVITADGKRVVWGLNGQEETPVWHGTLFDWWLTGR